MTRYIFITGGVASGIGKGITAASIGALLKNTMKCNVTIKKLDPYLNIDPGTMNPGEHGEVFVTNDGLETDLDIGHYERFLWQKMSAKNSITSGKLYENLIKKERNGTFLGKTVQMIPHFTDEIIEFITGDCENVVTENSYTNNIIVDYDFVIVEIGGTVGDMEAACFLEAIRQMRLRFGSNNTFFIHVSQLIYQKSTNELKTKPTQNSVKDLLSIGIQPDMLICRTEQKINDSVKTKLSTFTNVEFDNIIEAIDLPSVYMVPAYYHEQSIVSKICEKMNYSNILELVVPEFWNNIYNDLIIKHDKTINIGIVGKYTNNHDTYKSIIESLYHCQHYLKININIKIICSRDTDFDIKNIINDIHGIIVPGGFGNDGIQNKVKTIQYCRENDIPMLGICLGMQLAVIEFMQNVNNMPSATSEEFDDDLFEHDERTNIIRYVKSFNRDNISHLREKTDALGGTMRLGAYETKLKPYSFIFKIFGNKTSIYERHRHRYEVDSVKIQKQCEDNGMMFTGISDDGFLEVVEIPTNRFFVATQFHPEFTSQIGNPSKLFLEFTKTCYSL